MTAQPPAIPLYAGFWRRVAASFIDSLILMVPAIIGPLFLSDGLLNLVLQLAVACAYYALQHASESQATLGKRIFGIKVTDLEGNRIGIGRAIGRYFGLLLSSFLLLVGLLMAAFTRRKQALHDMIFSTLVVNREAEPQEVAAGGGTMAMTLGVWIVAVFLGILPFFGGMAAAIAIPAYQDYTARAKMVEVIAAGNALTKQVEQAMREKRPWPTGRMPIDTRYATEAEITPRGTVSVTVTTELVRNGGRIQWTPVDRGGTIEWMCTSNDVPARLLPRQCRE